MCDEAPGCRLALGHGARLRPYVVLTADWVVVRAA